MRVSSERSHVARRPHCMWPKMRWSAFGSSTESASASGAAAAVGSTHAKIPASGFAVLSARARRGGAPSPSLTRAQSAIVEERLHERVEVARRAQIVQPGRQRGRRAVGGVALERAFALELDRTLVVEIHEQRDRLLPHALAVLAEPKHAARVVAAVVTPARVICARARAAEARAIRISEADRGAARVALGPSAVHGGCVKSPYPSSIAARCASLRSSRREFVAGAAFRFEPPRVAMAPLPSRAARLLTAAHPFELST